MGDPVNRNATYSLHRIRTVGFLKNLIAGETGQAVANIQILHPNGEIGPNFMRISDFNLHEFEVVDVVFHQPNAGQQQRENTDGGGGGGGQGRKTRRSRSDIQHYFSTAREPTAGGQAGPAGPSAAGPSGQQNHQSHKYLEQCWNATNEKELNQLATPQFVFDGCIVQGDRVYIGNSFVRKRSLAEQQVLEQFDQKFTSYQESMGNEFRRQVEQAFGKSFGKLFGASYNVAGESDESSTTGTGSELSDGKQSGNATLPEMPKSPGFCTVFT